MVGLHCPLHSAAWKGHMAIFHLIMEIVEDKNPKDNEGFLSSLI